MPDPWIQTLHQRSLEAGVSPWRAASGDGTLLATAFGARLLAAALPGVPGNLFWHDPAFERGERSKVNGGDRLWLAPEVAFMWEDLAAAREDPRAAYALPAAMDPADWRIEVEAPDRFGLVAEMTLVDHRDGGRFRARLRRAFDVHVGPPAGLDERLAHAGFFIENAIELLEFETGTQVGPVAGTWDLLQMPPGGTLFVPTLGIASPNSYYDPFGAHHVHVAGDHVQFRIDGGRRIKMGLPAEAVTGRMGYYRPLEAVSTLIVRHFLPEPGRPYVDVPRDREARFGGDALQAYNDDGVDGGFGEMEHHDPALIAGDGPSFQRSRSVTHLFAGPDEAIREVGRHLLGVAIDPAV